MAHNPKKKTNLDRFDNSKVIISAWKAEYKTKADLLGSS